MSGVDLIREEPPRPADASQGRLGIPAWLHEVKAEPGEWFRFALPVPPSAATRVRKGYVSEFEAGEFEVVTAVTDPFEGKPRSTMWARYVGGES